jgi:hypothetical protein
MWHCHLVVENVALPVEDDFIPGTGDRGERDLVAHSPAGNEHRRFGAEQLANAPLELDRCRIVAEDVVADGSVGDGLAHGGHRTRNGIAAKIDHLRHGSTFLVFDVTGCRARKWLALEDVS